MMLWKFKIETSHANYIYWACANLYSNSLMPFALAVPSFWSVDKQTKWQSLGHKTNQYL